MHSSAHNLASNAVVDSEIAILRRFWYKSRHRLTFTDHHADRVSRLHPINGGVCDICLKGENLVSGGAAAVALEALCRLLEAL